MRLPWPALADLAAVAASRVGGILVNLVFLPIFLRHLGPVDFGIVAVILSLQPLVLFMDFGLSTLVGRDVAASSHDAAQLVATGRTFHRAEQLLALLYTAVLALAVLLAFAVPAYTAPAWIAAGSVVLFGLVVAQNLSAAVLLNASQFRTIGVVQSIGPLVRGATTAAALALTGGGLEAFLAAQVAVSLLHFLVTRAMAARVFGSGVESDPVDVRGTSLRALVGRAKPLLLLGLFGAIASQFDKVLIGALASAIAVGPYFLAYTFALVPIAILSGPVTQLYMPRLIAAHEARSKAGGQIAETFGRVILVVVLPVTLCLWLYRFEWCYLWLRDAAMAPTTAEYAGVLLQGSVVGALGFPPNVLLVARQDFGFLGLLQTVLAIAYVSGIALLLVQGFPLVSVAWLYVVYSTASTVGQWARALHGMDVRPLASRMLNGICLALLTMTVVFGPVAFACRWITPPWLGMTVFTTVAGLATVVGVIRALGRDALPMAVR